VLAARSAAGWLSANWAGSRRPTRARSRPAWASAALAGTSASRFPCRGGRRSRSQHVTGGAVSSAVVARRLSGRRRLGSPVRTAHRRPPRIKKPNGPPFPGSSPTPAEFSPSSRRVLIPESRHYLPRRRRRAQGPPNPAVPRLRIRARNGAGAGRSHRLVVYDEHVCSATPNAPDWPWRRRSVRCAGGGGEPPGAPNCSHAGWPGLGPRPPPPSAPARVWPLAIR